MNRLTSSIIILSLLLPPLLAVWLLGYDLTVYLNFPFITPPAQHEVFSWFVWCLMLVIVLGITLPLLLHALRYRIKITPISKIRRFPAWGIAACFLLIIFWILAWTRFTWFQSFQVHTYTPVWLCYIVIVNAITTYYKGSCLLTAKPLYLLSLFILSAAFWWYYEYLNGFIKNWYYVNIEQLTLSEYAFYSTLAYATVLPAVMSTTECLTTFPRIDQAFKNAWKINPASAKQLSIVSWLAGSITLTCAAVFPEQLFPFVWIAPLFIIAGVRYMLGEKTLFTSPAQADWRPIVIPAIAALICGFFWELWNSKSFAHWEYNIPYVDAFLLFEMPVIGYAGYLPFGIVCLAVAELLRDTELLFDSET